jgi:Na+-driven multidrug efflux pump
MNDLNTLTTVLAVLVAVFGTARLTRIFAHDDYPPAEWVRAHWLALVGDNWGNLMRCIWCFQPYVAAICIAWGYFSGLHWTWWAFWGWMALSQAGSTLLAYDEPAE